MRKDALQIFEAAVKAVQPSQLLPKYIQVFENRLKIAGTFFPFTQCKNIYVIGAGKAAAAMASEAEKVLGEHLTGGIIVTKYAHCLPLTKVRCLEAAHPVPDEAGVAATKEILDLLHNTTENDLVLALISGGASALLADYPPGTSLSDVQEVNRLLLECGATIEEMNTVRKHLSSIKGGGLTRAAFPATIVALILSDVPGNHLHVIASGPTIPDPTTFSEAVNVLQKYALTDHLPPAIHQWFLQGINGQIPETPKPGDTIFNCTHNHLIGTNAVALHAAADKAKALGYLPVLLPGELSGEARETAAALVQSFSKSLFPRPACLLLGGETTVTIRRSGKGGRNQEFALAALIELQKFFDDKGQFPVWLAAGTDGSDGPTEVTGAVIDRETILTMVEQNIDPLPYLTDNNAYHFFKKAGGHVITGPTQTNVMDIVIVLLK